LVGVVFSLVLVNVQGGLFLGLIRKASVLVDHCGADIWIGHRGVETVEFAKEIPEAWIYRVRSMDGVERASAYVVGKGIMTLPSGDFEDVWVIGADPATMLGSAWTFAEGSRDDLLLPSAVSIEKQEAWKLGYPKVGDVVEINDARARVAAITDGIVGFVAAPYVFSTLDAARTFSEVRDGYCSYFLISAKPGVSLAELKSRIAQRLPDADVFLREEIAGRSREYWMLRTGIGVSFGTSTILGLLVGLVMVAQSLYALALDHLTDYATLKAIGAEDKHVYQVLFLQALAVAGAGVALGMAIVEIIRRVGSTPYAPILIPGWLTAASIALVVGICIAACLLPFRRIRDVDPVVVLQ
jgi:putative ABC transport system permease protein